MRLSLALMAGVAGLAGITGLVTLVRPAVTRRVLRVPASEAATYALRIAGMMLFALGLFLGCFLFVYFTTVGAA